MEAKTRKVLISESNLTKESSLDIADASTDKFEVTAIDTDHNDDIKEQEHLKTCARVRISEPGKIENNTTSSQGDTTSVENQTSIDTTTSTVTTRTRTRTRTSIDTTTSTVRTRTRTKTRTTRPVPYSSYNLYLVYITIPDLILNLCVSFNFFLVLFYTFNC